jgi:hypothetical protein
LTKILYRIKRALQDLKASIQEGDNQFEDDRREAEVMNIIKRNKYHEHIVFSQAKKRRQLEGERLIVVQMRHKMYDNLIDYVNRYAACNLTEVLYTNKNDFCKIFVNKKLAPQFELSV